MAHLAQPPRPLGPGGRAPRHVGDRTAHRPAAGLPDRQFGTYPARRGITLLAFSPAAYVFSMAYSEPLFLLLAGLYFLGRTRPLSPVLAGLAMLTRVTGVAIAASAAVRWLQDRRDWPALLSVLAAGAVFAGWWLFIWRLTGDPAGWMQGSPSWQPTLGIPAI